MEPTDYGKSEEKIKTKSVKLLFFFREMRVFIFTV